ncbi:MAG: radical SAM protein [Theionarchaea archaeon]|nr:radical SAM protein [Theionarchaea archaeon]MBU7037358.1 radical SAM protein [Theionarchaea archaeon]
MKVRLDITTRCNLNCLHCGATEFKTEREWTTEEALQAFESMISYGIDHFDFLGGEPFIRKDILELFSHLSDQGARILVVTNGLLLNEEIIDFLANLETFSGISVSIDGASREVHETIRGKNTFDRTVANVQALLSRRNRRTPSFTVGLTCVLNRMNVLESGAMMELADQIDVDSVSFTPMGWIGNARKNKDDLYIDPQEEFTAYDKAIRRVIQINRVRAIKGKHPLRFPIDSIPFTWKYHFVKKYPLVHQISGKFKCLAGTGTFHVDGSGVLYPCEAVKIHRASIESEIGEYRSMSLPEYTFEEIVKSGFFKKTVAYIRDRHHLTENVVPCKDCKYGDGCSVCPLHARSEGIVRNCVEDTMKGVVERGDLLES